MNEKLCKAINEQITNELFASNSYLAISIYLDTQDLPVLTQFFLNQADEERMHSLKLMRYLMEIDAAVEITEIPKPKNQFDSVLAAMDEVLELEVKTTDDINNLMTLAKETSEHATVSFLQWFVDEQVEEMATMRELRGLVRRAGETQLLLVEDRLLKKGVQLTSPAGPGA
jgi:ferritin